ncbi:hypothetical protein [Fulvivirga sp.]|uniref:hypothetical protein n=1 Tax=Fulvivirga sp. TaxID=1931237 RepID=UPI0032EAA1B8
MILGLLLSLSAQAFGQVEHNFEMSPENTDCHELTLTSVVKKNIELIRNTTFRVKEEMKVSRYYVPTKIEYFSCDGVIGYMIAHEHDSVKLYKEVRKTLWDSLTNTNDPINFYQQNFKND